MRDLAEPLRDEGSAVSLVSEGLHTNIILHGPMIVDLCLESPCNVLFSFYHEEPLAVVVFVLRYIPEMTRQFWWFPSG